jgi:hypothetical protein
LEKPGPALYSPECVEVEFCELRLDGILRRFLGSVRQIKVNETLLFA